MNVAVKIIVVTRGHKILHEQEEEENNHKLIVICSAEKENFFFFNYHNLFFLSYQENCPDICYIMNLTCRFACLCAECMDDVVVIVVVVVSVDAVVVCFIMYSTIYRYR
jgi:hypothetical protein